MNIERLRSFEEISLRDYALAREKRIPRIEIVAFTVVRLYLRRIDDSGSETGAFCGDAHIDEAKHQESSSQLMVTYKKQETGFRSQVTLNDSNLVVDVTSNQEVKPEIGFMTVEGINSKFDVLLGQKELELAA